MFEKDSCQCNINTDYGSWEQSIKIKAPTWSSKEYIWIDKCLVDEIKYLWKLGIETTGCCCGHKQSLPYIGVDYYNIGSMIELGYIMETNPHLNDNGSKRMDNFYPKSISVEPQMVEKFISHYYDVGLITIKV